MCSHVQHCNNLHLIIHCVFSAAIFDRRKQQSKNSASYSKQRQDGEGWWKASSSDGHCRPTHVCIGAHRGSNSCGQQRHAAHPSQSHSERPELRYGHSEQQWCCSSWVLLPVRDEFCWSSEYCGRDFNRTLKCSLDLKLKEKVWMERSILYCTFLSSLRSLFEQPTSDMLFVIDRASAQFKSLKNTENSIQTMFEF